MRVDSRTHQKTSFLGIPAKHPLQPPENVVAIEKQKEADALAKIETLKASLASLL